MSDFDEGGTSTSNIIFIGMLPVSCIFMIFILIANDLTTDRHRKLGHYLGFIAGTIGGVFISKQYIMPALETSAYNNKKSYNANFGYGIAASLGAVISCQLSSSLIGGSLSKGIFNLRQRYRTINNQEVQNQATEDQQPVEPMPSIAPLL